MHFLLKAFKSYITIQNVNHAFLFHVQSLYYYNIKAYTHIYIFREVGKTKCMINILEIYIQNYYPDYKDNNILKFLQNFYTRKSAPTIQKYNSTHINLHMYTTSIEYMALGGPNTFIALTCSLPLPCSRMLRAIRWACSFVDRTLML